MTTRKQRGKHLQPGSLLNENAGSNLSGNQHTVGIARAEAKLILANIAYNFDRLIFLPTMRTHAWARITMALKLGMGLVPVPDRKNMHRTALEQMLGELNLYFKPDLIILDGRKCFINGGPDSGEERAPGVLLASTGRVAIDTEAVRILKALGACGLDMPAEDVPMIRTARELGVT